MASKNNYKWIAILASEAQQWNKGLKTSNASFFQYPYYASGYDHFSFCKAKYILLQHITTNEIVAFCSLLHIGFRPFKIALVIRGPVILNTSVIISEVINSLANYCKQNKYSLLRINPNDASIAEFLKHDELFIKKDLFPYYKGSQQYDLNIKYMPEELLLQSFKNRCRQKIKYAEEVTFEFSKINTVKELDNVYRLFKKVSRKKKFSYRPLNSYKEIFKNGLADNLCNVYTASLDKEIVCAAFVVKDNVSFNYLSGALIIKNFNSKNSPANKLHYLITKDCFYNENKEHYNISYSAPASETYVFKSSFNPTAEEKPAFYSYVIDKKILTLFKLLQLGKFSTVKKKMRSLMNLR